MYLFNEMHTNMEHIAVPHPPQCAHWGTFPPGEGIVRHSSLQTPICRTLGDASQHISKSSPKGIPHLISDISYLISASPASPTRSTLFPFSFFHFLYAFYLTQGQKWGIVSGGGGRCAFVLNICAPFRGCGDQNAAELPCDVNMPPLTGCMSGKMSNSLQKPRNEGGIFQSGVPYAGKNQGPLR